MTRIEFEVAYNPQLIEKVGDFMAKCDLGITGAEMPIINIWSWSTTTKIDAGYVYKMKRAIAEAIEADGSRVISIKRRTIKE